MQPCTMVLVMLLLMTMVVVVMVVMMAMKWGGGGGIGGRGGKARGKLVGGVGRTARLGRAAQSRPTSAVARRYRALRPGPSKSALQTPARPGSSNSGPAGGRRR